MSWCVRACVRALSATCLTVYFVYVCVGQCTCQLYLLLQWYQDQNHEVGNADASSMGSNWTCTTSGPSNPVAPTRPAGSHDVTTDAPSGGERRVTELTYCQDTEIHCQTLEHWAHHVKGSSQVSKPRER